MMIGAGTTLVNVTVLHQNHTDTDTLYAHWWFIADWHVKLLGLIIKQIQNLEQLPGSAKGAGTLLGVQERQIWGGGDGTALRPNVTNRCN